MDIRPGGCEITFLFVQVGALFADDTFAIHHNDIFESRTERYIQFRTRYGRGTCTVYDNFNVFNLLSCYFKGVDKSCAGDDGRTVLVIVHHRDIEFFFQTTFYLEAFRCLDIFQIDTTERRSDGFHCFDEFFRIFFVHFDVEHIDASVDFEE